MAKPKGPTNSKTGNKLPAKSSIEITEKEIPSSLDVQLEQLKLDKESKKQKREEAKQELFISSLTQEEKEERQKAQLSERISWFKDRFLRDKKVKEELQKESKKPKTIVLGPKVGIEEYISELNKGVCTIEFYKRTSRPPEEFRRMRCTLKDKKVVPQNPLNPGIITVWDLDKGDWRSFYHTRIIKLIRNEETDAE